MSGFLKKGNGKIIIKVYIFIFLVCVFACTMILSCRNYSENLEGPLEITESSSGSTETDDLSSLLENNNDSSDDLGETSSEGSSNGDLLNDEVDENITNDSSDIIAGDKEEEETNSEENVEDLGQTDGEEMQNEGNSSGQNEDEEIDSTNKDYFRIEVNLSLQKVFIFYKDNLIKEMICSGGIEEKPTPPGEFTTTEKGNYFWNDKYKMGAYYWVRFYNEYLFHSVPFNEDNQMIQEECDKLGTPASHGCIRLKLEEAKWLYDMLPLGVKVVIY